MKVKIEKRTDYFGKVEYLVWVENTSTIYVRCIGIFDNLEDAEKVYEETLLKVREPKMETIKEQIL